MEIKIQSIHFDATDKLEAFIEKKVAKLEKAFEDIQKLLRISRRWRYSASW